MKANVVVSVFEVESEAFQGITELKQNPGNDTSYVTGAALIKKENGTLRTLDSFDTGTHTADDTLTGGLIGAFVGILGGPLGVLLGGSYGALIGAAVDADDTVQGISLIEQTAGKLDEGETAIIGLAFEEDEAILDQKLGRFKTTIYRYDADAVEAEVEEAQKLEKEMARQARQELRDDKKASRKEKRAEKKSKMSAEWASFKGKFKKEDKEA